MRKVLIYNLVILFLCGCATQHLALTSSQRRIIEAKELEGTYEDVFGATVSVLQDKGYQIINSDSQEGIIFAETSKEVFSRFWGQQVAYKVTIHLEKFTENRSNMRLTIYSQVYNGIGVEVPNDSGFVDNPQVYQDFYAKIQNEIFRREQLNK